MNDERYDHTHLALFGFALAFVGLSFLAMVVMQWHRSHPPIDIPLPHSIEEIKTPPSLIVPCPTDSDCKG